MPRNRPGDRLDRLVESGARVFTERGYRRTQMADVAREMGVAPGTLYLYVESKEALFDLVIQRAFVHGGGEPPSLPLPTPAAGTTLEHLRRRVAREWKTPELDLALKRQRPTDVEKELGGIVRELYRSLSHSWRAVALIERSALDWPELATVWYGEVRVETMAKIHRYLERRVRQKLLRPVASLDATARLLLESIAWPALHRRGDRLPPQVTEPEMEEAVVEFATHALLRRKP